MHVEFIVFFLFEAFNKIGRMKPWTKQLWCTDNFKRDTAVIIYRNIDRLYNKINYIFKMYTHVVSLINSKKKNKTKKQKTKTKKNPYSLKCTYAHEHILSYIKYFCLFLLLS